MSAPEHHSPLRAAALMLLMAGVFLAVYMVLQPGGAPLTGTSGYVLVLFGSFLTAALVRL